MIASSPARIHQEANAVARSRWVLEIHHEQKDENSLIATQELDNLPLLRIVLVQNRGRKFIVRPPVDATAKETKTLLDLRAQGFDIAVQQ